jgi:hypothetical protein
MRKLAIAVVLIVIGTVIGLFLRAYRVIPYPQYHKTDNNDPPVTVSDSSLHGRSPHLWVRDADGGKTIRPIGTKLQDTCGFDGLATFNYMDRDYDFSPTAAVWLITLTYADDTVTIGSDGSLKIVSAKYYFDPAPGDDKGHRKHHLDGDQYKTTHITAIGVAEPVDMDIDTVKNGHFKIRFCYE